ncbi:hypothetical protein C8F01DRAFT_1127312 [Mycena amicta]|nr:hypothetical protein C8F01DRAFT_1127312 [Mycena amicta]
MGHKQWSVEETQTLITEMSKVENFKVLFGKEAGENTSGDSKPKVHARIAEMLGLGRAKEGAKRVERKISALSDTFKKHMQRLKKTGEGLTEDDCQWHYVEPDGPHHDTPPEACNIWEAITREFIYFPALYRLWSTRPNLVPICATTALTPAGRHRTILIQADCASAPVSASVPGPESQTHAGTLPSSSPPLWPANQQYLGGWSQSQSNVTPPTPSPAPMSNAMTATPRSGPRPSSLVRAPSSLPSVPKKRGLEDEIVDVTKTTLAAFEKQSREADKRKRRKLDLQEREVETRARELLFKEYEAGLWSKEEYLEKVAALKSNNVDDDA